MLRLVSKFLFRMVVCKIRPFPVGQLSQQQAVMHAQAMQQAQFAMHQQMHQAQYLHTAPVVHPISHANYHHQAQNININIHAAVDNGAVESNTTTSAVLPITSAAVSDGNEVKIEDAEKVEDKAQASEDKSSSVPKNSEDKKEEK